MSKTVVDGIKKFAGASFKKLPKSERTNIVEKMMPYRTTGVANLAIIAGAATVGGVRLGNEVSKVPSARELGEFRAHALANQVGRSPLRYSDEFIQGIPERAGRVESSLMGPGNGSYARGYDDLGAGGDLVFALNNLR